MIISTAMSIAGPVTNVFYPSVVAIPNGIVMMLLLAKVPKKGALTICGTIQGILFLLVGGFWLIPVALIVGGIICDFPIMGRNEITMKSMMIAYTIFSGIFAFGAIVGPMSFLRNAFVAAMEKNNIAQEYIDGMIRITSGFYACCHCSCGLARWFNLRIYRSESFEKAFYQGGTCIDKIAICCSGNAADVNMLVDCLQATSGAEMTASLVFLEDSMEENIKELITQRQFQRTATL